MGFDADASCPQLAQSRSAASPTAARSTVVAPTAPNPNIHSQLQTTTALATTVNQTGMPCVSGRAHACLLYTSPSPRDRTRSRMPSSA